MSEPTVDMNTDEAWEEWGRRDPYFGVITHPKYRRREMKEASKHEFFESGKWHVEYVMKTIHDHIDPDFKPDSVLDFGCGVGRTLVSFAQIASRAVGLDVSISMLDEAGINCRERGLSNVSLLRSDDTLSKLAQPFDLIHSSIVFQHIPSARGRAIFRTLLTRFAPRGIGAIQFLYAKSRYRETYGTAPTVIARSPRFAFWRAKPQAPALPSGSDPEIQMNPYSLNDIMFLVHEAGAQRLYVDFTDHGGELGLFVFFQVN
jgi:SAM-dependent methyltransferase